MTSQVQYLAARPAGALFDKKKGPMSNRVQACAAQYVNKLKTRVEQTAVVGGGVALTALAAKYPTFKKALDKPFQMIANGFKKVVAGSPKLTTVVTSLKAGAGKILPHIKNAPLLAKIGVPVALALVILSRTFKQGQIDQKYNDRARLLKHNVG